MTSKKLWIELIDFMTFPSYDLHINSYWKLLLLQKGHSFGTDQAAASQQIKVSTAAEAITMVVAALPMHFIRTRWLNVIHQNSHFLSQQIKNG